MRIFITGASGFIGRHLLALLSGSAHELLFLVQDQKDRRLLSQCKAKLIIGDLKDISRISKAIVNFNPAVCIHLAWAGIPDYSFAMSKINLDNSLRLINLLIEATRCRKIIVSGSCAEYGRLNGKCQENDEVKINSYFSWAKYVLYLYSNYISQRYGLNLIWFRIFYVYGPGQRNDSLIPTLIEKFSKGKLPQIKNLFNANDFIYVKDIASAFSLAITKEIPSGIYNLGSGRSHRVSKICKIVQDKIGGKERLGYRFNKNVTIKEAVNFWADTQKSSRILGWHASTDLKLGIQECIEYWKDKGK